MSFSNGGFLLGSHVEREREREGEVGKLQDKVGRRC